jgi:hypothetical protein
MIQHKCAHDLPGFERGKKQVTKKLSLSKKLLCNLIFRAFNSATDVPTFASDVHATKKFSRQ